GGTPSTTTAPRRCGGGRRGRWRTCFRSPGRPSRAGRTSGADRLRRAGLGPLLFLLLELGLDPRAFLRHLVHADRALRPAGEELADDGVVGLAHLLLGR